MDELVAEMTPKRCWNDLRKVLERNGPMSDEYFDSESGLDALSKKVLIVGAGGLGCELVKSMALMGFTDIDIIDCDTIDLSNLNRQFLFRTKDIGRPKAEVAAEFINRRVAGCQVTPHYSRIEEKDLQFYSQFYIIVCGLDAIEPRRWLNSMVFQLLTRCEDGTFDNIIPIVDGGTEGFQGNVRVIIPSKSYPCIECQLDLFPPRITFPLCTISNRPRLPEHCIEYARVVLWSRDRPFGDAQLDGDDPAHLQWIYEKSLDRAKEFNIDGVNYRLTQGVVKHIIPAVASTNAAIASACVTEVFKLFTGAARPLKNYMTFNDALGISTSTIEMAPKPDCDVCNGLLPVPITVPRDCTLQSWISMLQADYGFVKPILATKGSIILYMPMLHDKFAANLEKNLAQLPIAEGQEVLVSDSRSRKMFVIHFT